MVNRIQTGAGGLLVALAGFAPLAWSANAQKAGPPPTSFESVNVCERVTGEAVAKAVAGRLIDTRPVNIKGFAPARCVYGVEVAGTRRAFVLWVNPASDFEGLRTAAEGPVQPVTGIGDEAYVTTDKETKRAWLRAVKRGKAAIQVSGDQADWLQAIAKLALSTF